MNFALFSENAGAVELCLYEGAKGNAEAGRVMLTRADRPGLARLRPRPRVPASATATACTGPTSRQRGHRFNANKLLIDPYARAIDGHVRWNERIFGYTLRPSRRRPLASTSATARTRCRNRWWSTPQGEWATEYARLRDPWSGTPIYELHVKGFTIRHPEVPGGGARDVLRASRRRPSSTT